MMTEDQFKALLNVVTAGFDKLSEGMKGNQSDHDIIVRLVTISEQTLKRLEENHKEFLSHKFESTPIRDSVKTCEEHVTLCKQEKRPDMLKRHDDFIRTAAKALWVAYGAIIGLAAKVFFFKEG